MEAVKTILTLPYKIGSVVDKVNHTLDAHKLLIRQPKHCTILNAVIWRWRPELSGEEDLFGLDTKFEQIDITPRLQTLWCLYDEHEHLEWTTGVELLNKLNAFKLVNQEDGEEQVQSRWLLLVTYRHQASSPIFRVCIRDNLNGQFKFPPYDTRKRMMINSQTAYKTVGFELRSGQWVQESLAEFTATHPSLAYLLGPKRDLFASTGSATPAWLVLQILHQHHPEIVRLELFH